MVGKMSRLEMVVLVVAICSGAWAAVQLGYFLNLNSVSDFLVYLALAPLLEEYIFRSHLQQFIADRWSAPWFGLLAASCIFVMCHMPWIGWMAFGLLVPAFVLGWYWLRFKSLWLNSGLHSLFNCSLALVTVAV
jgi:membrane protease YdiL (CAAX protease family)